MSDISSIELAPNRVVAALHPLKSEAATFTVNAGRTIAEIFDVIGADPILIRHAHVYVGDNYVPAELWARVRPKPGVLISVRAFIPPEGGGGEGGGGKDILRSVLLIAVAAAALFFAPAVGGMLGLTGAFGASVGQAIIGLGGMLLVNALVPPRQPSRGAGAVADDSPTKFIEGARNRLTPFEPVPVPFGAARFKPPFAAQPITELVGDDQYLRLIFNWGIGPIALDDATLKIGDTLLSDFDDVQIEHRYGYDSDTAPTLYPATVDQQNYQITLLAADGYTVRTTSPDADEIGIDIVFPEGLLVVADDGTRSNSTVAIQVEYSPAGANSWQKIPTAGGTRTFPAEWSNTVGGTFDTITFSQRRTNAVRHGFTFKTSTRGAYDVRIRRGTPDTDSENIRDTVVWSTMRRITNESPVQSPIPVALTVLRIKATDQLNGVIDEFSGIPERVCLDWDIDTQTWIERATKNPASLFRYALQGRGLQVPYPDAAIDLTALSYWHEFCTDHGFEYNRIHDFTASLWDTLGDIAAAGRADRQNIDGKWTVIIDEPKSVVSHVTPRNSFGFNAEKAFVEYPHAFRVQFNNEREDFRNDEIRVYLDGYTAETATVFETIEFPGVTDPDLIYKHARFNAAIGVHRPEVWNFRQDMERLAYRRGSVVNITHDVILVGTSYGRIRSVETDGGGDVIGVTIDAPLTMDEFQSYAITIRSADHGALTAQVVTVPGVETTALSFVSAFPGDMAPEVGDLYGFGILGQDTDKAIILDIDPIEGEFAANVSCVPYREVVYSIDAGPIPPFVTNLTPISDIPDVTVSQIRSDETALTVGAGESLNVRINVKVLAYDNLDATLQVEIRPNATNEPYLPAQVESLAGNEVSIGDVRSNEYFDIRLRWIVAGKLIPGRWTYVYNHRVVGKATDPEPLNGMTLSTFGGQAFIRWDKPKELDVIFGGEVRFRHSTDEFPEWNNSTSIGNVAQARSLLATLPLKPGTYLARVFDQSGNYSTTVSISTVQASVLEFGPVDTLEEGPDFDGSKTNVAVDGIFLRLNGQGEFDSIPDLDEVIDLDYYGGLYTFGQYVFQNGFDFLALKRVRLTVRLNVVIADITDNIDEWVGTIDSRMNFDGDDTADADCVVYVSLTDDDPNGPSPVWKPFERLDSMEVYARGCRFRAILTSDNADFNVFVSELGVDAEEVI